MPTSAIFPRARARSGIYESFYLRAVAPDRPLGVWIRNTVEKAPGAPARGAIWCTVFDGARGRPLMRKLSGGGVSTPAPAWIAIAAGDAHESAQHAQIGPERADGACGEVAWSLSYSALASELRHLAHAWLYRAPLPRTKLTSPAPDALFDGSLTIASDRTLTLSGWHGMLGHNWGAEHAERWIWLHGVGFAEDRTAWLDVALGRIAISGRLTPWVANGALSLDGRRIRLGGLGARGLHVRESVEGCTLRLPGERGATVQARVEVPRESAAGWRYGDPNGGPGHDVVNCSIASLELSVELPGEGDPRSLTSAHGAAYELGMRERDHGVPIAPFDDA
ncbi:MAG TPA: hypothetical protein VH081_06965 [Solirubrobacteraceae bacterium]|nr:hypothetical protein [Solirubrobacteraceae bacterium]